MKKAKSKSVAARTAGKIHEGYVQTPLVDLHDFKVVAYSEYKKMLKSKKRLPPRLLVRGMPFTTIYGTQGNTEFWLRATDAKPAGGLAGATADKPLICRIECKNQESAGSVDEKFPYLVMTLENFPENDVILVAHLSGARQGAQDWVHTVVGTRALATPEGRKTKRIKIMGTEAFKTWAHQAFHQTKRDLERKTAAEVHKAPIVAETMSTQLSLLG